MAKRDRTRHSARTVRPGAVRIGRRDFLRMTGLTAGGAAMLASCADETGGATGTTEPAPATGTTSATPTTAPTVSREYAYTTVRHPKSVKTTLYGINNRGETVGYFDDGRRVHGFLRAADGTFTGIVDHPEAGDTTALFGVNGTGAAVGYYHDKSGRGGYPGATSPPAKGVTSFVYSVEAKEFRSIEAPDDGTGTVVAFGINDSGLVSGWYFARDPSGRSQALVKGFLWSTEDGRHLDTFRHQDDAGDGTFATGINNAGLVVGQFIGEDKTPHAFVRDSARRSFSIRSIDHPEVRANEGGTGGMAISDTGVVAGFYLDPEGTHAYLRADRDTFVELKHDEVSTGMSACGVNTAGTVVGDFTDSRGGTLGYLATPA